MAPDSDHLQNPKACEGALARAFGFLGKRWNGVLLGALAPGPTGFSELRRALGGISDSVLSERLSELTGAGLVLRSVNAGPPVSVDYRLTPAGVALLPALDELATWAAQNLPQPADKDACTEACAEADVAAKPRGGRARSDGAS
jgi:DNA-binding HxlR family transcriptional regulator